MSTKILYRIGLMLVVITLFVGGVFVGVPASSSGLLLPLILRGWPSSIAQYTTPLISEVLYNPSNEEPEGEWFELYNPADFPISLDDKKIGDSETIGDYEGMYKFPQNTTMLPGDVIVVANRAENFYSVYGVNPNFELSDTDPAVPDMVKYSAWANGSINLSNLGDELILLGSADDIADSVSWGSSTSALDPSVPSVQDGHSIARWPANWDRDIAEDWIDQPRPQPGIVDISTPTPVPTLTSVATFTPIISAMPCGSTSLLISEVLYDPDQYPESNGEWFEIVNLGDQDINLSCFQVGDEETTGGREGMLRFPSGFILSPGGVMVVAFSAEYFYANYGFYPDFEYGSSLPDVPDMIKNLDYATGSLDLNNDGDEVLLLDVESMIVDAVSWGSSTYAFVPSVIKVSNGSSIERRPVYSDTDSALDWSEQAFPNPGDVDFTTPNPIPSQSSTLSPTLTKMSQPTLTNTLIPTSTATPSPSPTQTSTSTATSTNTPDGSPGTTDLLISEVMYDPRSQEPDGEWIEIWNAGITTVDLTICKLGDEETDGGVEGMYWFPQGSSLEPGEIVIVANRATEFNLIFSFLPDYEIYDSHLDVPDMVACEECSGGEFRLENTGDEVFILDDGDAIIDVVAYGQSEYLGFYPPVNTVAEGHSIERYPADVDTNTNMDWIDQVDPNPGTINLATSIR